MFYRDFLDCNKWRIVPRRRLTPVRGGTLTKRFSSISLQTLLKVIKILHISMYKIYKYCVKSWREARIPCVYFAVVAGLGGSSLDCGGSRHHRSSGIITLCLIPSLTSSNLILYTIVRCLLPHEELNTFRLVSYFGEQNFSSSSISHFL